MSTAERPFFSDFPNFKPNLEAHISAEFNRLAKQRQWKTNSKTWRKMWNKCIDQEYNRLIGHHLSSLQNWQRLCKELDLKEPFMSITQCKKALSKVYVNIVDVLDCRVLKTKPKKFKNVHELSEYTRRTGKFFRKELAKQDKLLRVLLKKLVWKRSD